eukprot:scaffold79182_cov20-Tisochrysis_lutea.AAC.2
MNFGDLCTETRRAQYVIGFAHVMQIYASRGNGSWAETQEWLLPKVAEAAKPFPLSPSQKSGSSSVQRYVPYSAEIVSSLITGQPDHRACVEVTDFVAAYAWGGKHRVCQG